MLQGPNNAPTPSLADERSLPNDHLHDGTATVSFHSGAESFPADTELPAIPGHEMHGVLGRGGMGVVYKATHLELKRPVAVKMILGAPDAAEMERFRKEAQAVARIQHPHVVQIFEIGEFDGRPFLSLEYVEGGSLRQRLGNEPQAPAFAAQLVATLARAVHAAHLRGVVHRDLKPGNILLTADGTPKISDFGLAKHLDAPDEQTRTGAIMGTPTYMSPEQAGGKTKDIGPL